MNPNQRYPDGPEGSGTETAQAGADRRNDPQEQKIQRLLLGGFLLLIVLLAADAVISFSTIVSIRRSVSELTNAQFRNVALIDEVQRAHSALSSVMYALSADPDTVDRRALRQAILDADATMTTLFRDIDDRDPDYAIWHDVKLASKGLSEEMHQILTAPQEEEPDLTRLREAREVVIHATGRLIRANHVRAEETSKKIEAVARYQLLEDGILLGACLVVGCLCVWLVMRTTKRLNRQIAEQHEELNRVSWQLLEKQEHLSRRLSHELHDELGQSLTALKANFTRHAHSSCVDPAWMEDCSLLLRDSIRSAHEISQLLRPTILDDFGLDSALGWLCERFEDRQRITVHYASNVQERLAPEAETQLFRIAQEALTNVAKHAKATEVWVSLMREGDTATLRIADNGVGLPEATERPEPTRGTGVGTGWDKGARPHYGLTGIRARARTLQGEMTVRRHANATELRPLGEDAMGGGPGTEIFVRFPWSVCEHKEEDTHSVGR